MTWVIIITAATFSRLWIVGVVAITVWKFTAIIITVRVVALIVGWWWIVATIVGVMFRIKFLF